MEHSAAAATTTTTLLRRSNLQGNQTQNDGTSTTPKKSHLNLEALSSSSYTSLKDMLPFSAAAAVNSPTSASSASADISIRNRLVKQAAWAYLQPISPRPCGPSGPIDFLRRLRHRFPSENQHSHRHRRGDPLSPCFSFVSRIVSRFKRVMHQVLNAFRGQVPTL